MEASRSCNQNCTYRFKQFCNSENSTGRCVSVDETCVTVPVNERVGYLS